MEMDPLRDVAGQNVCSWRQRALAHIAELQTQLNRTNSDSVKVEDTQRHLDEARKVAIVEGAQRHLDAARKAAAKMRGPITAWSGSAVERTWSNINKVEVALLKLAPDKELAWWGIDVIARAQQHLGKQDPRRAKLEKHLRGTDGQLRSTDRYLAINTLQAANDAAQIERSSLRSFRNAVLGSTMALTAIAITLAVAGFVDPQILKLCFDDPKAGPACPIGDLPNKWDIAIVEVVGLAAAALIGALGLRHVRGTATPYTLPIVLGVLKLPAGAVSAVLGLLLIRGRFIPGLNDLDTTAQIVAWAAIFGAAQQSITRLVDTQGQIVLNGIRDSSRGIVEGKAV